MKDLLENNAGQADEKPAISVGKTLREARERLGLSITDVSRQTKIVSRQIEALEADDFQRLPEMTFVRGFVRCYARLLQVDDQPLLAALPQAATGPARLIPSSVEVPFPRIHAPQFRSLIGIAVALLVVVPAALYAVWHYTKPPASAVLAQVETQVTLPAEMQMIPASAASEAATPVAVVSAQTEVAPAQPSTERSATEPAQAAPAGEPAQQPEQTTPPVAATVTEVNVPLPSVTQPTTAAEVAPENAALRLVFDVESWAEVKDGNDKVILSRVNPGASEVRLEGRAPFSLVIGHALSTTLYFRGKLVDLTPYINANSEVARLTLR